MSSAHSPRVERKRGRAGVEQRARRLQAEPLCRICKAKGLITTATVPDHILALVNGGTDDDDNIQCLCDDCHATKTAEDLGRSEAVRDRGVDRSGRPTSPDHPWNRGRNDRA